MHAVRTIEPGHHPDTPPQADVAGLERPLWALYVEGAIFLRTPSMEDARHAQRVALDSGRYEFVDLICEEDRREGAERRTGLAEDAHHLRRWAESDRREA